MNVNFSIMNLNIHTTKAMPNTAHPSLRHRSEEALEAFTLPSCIIVPADLGTIRPKCPWR